MLSAKVYQPSNRYHLPLQLGIAVGAGLLLGISAVLSSPVWVLIALAVAVFSFVVLKKPEIGLLGLLIITSTIVPSDSLPRIPIGIGTIYVPDILLFGLLGLIVVRRLVERDFKINRTPLDIPLLAFYGIAMLSTLAAILIGSMTFNGSLGEIRVFSGYLAFFIVTNLMREEQQLSSLWNGMVLLGVLVASAMIAQYLLGDSIHLLPGRLETLATEGVTYRGVTRIIPPGDSLVLTAFIALTTILALDKYKLAHVSRLLLWGLLGVGVLLTFERHYFVAVGLALLILACLSQGAERRRLVKWGVGATVLIACGFALVTIQPVANAGGFLNGTLDRLGSLANSQTFSDPNSSLRWRDFEYQYALPQIVSHPLIGLGLGAQYRPLVPGKDWAGFDGRGYIHNGHLYVMLKTGLLGYACLAWLFLACLWRGFKYWRRIPDSRMRAVVLGSSLVLLGVLIGSIVSPILMSSNWTPVIGVLLGMNEAILSKAVQVRT